MSIQTREEIADELNEKVNAFNQYISSLDKEHFESTPGGKWSAGQNLEHLLRSMKPLQPAYSLPKFVLSMKFGKANRESKTYEALVAKYKLKLQQGGRAPARFTPPVIPFEEKNKVIDSYNNEKNKLVKKIRKQNENDLDKYILPHPLLGKLTLREMLFFTIYHNEHHLNLLKSRV